MEVRITNKKIGMFRQHRHRNWQIHNPFEVKSPAKSENRNIRYRLLAGELPKSCRLVIDVVAVAAVRDDRDRCDEHCEERDAD